MESTFSILCGAPLKWVRLSLMDSLLISNMFATVDAAIAFNKLCRPFSVKFAKFIMVILSFCLTIKFLFSIYTPSFIGVSDIGIFFDLIFTFLSAVINNGSPELKRKKSFLD